MHFANRLFWARCRERYLHWFTDPARVLECGSYNVNGTIRDYFTVTNYIGLDWRPGPDVDVISLAHLAPFAPESFDTVVSASMLEHDPYWEASVIKMCSILKRDGLLALSWGAARNQPHELASAPDGKFHRLSAGRVLAAITRCSLYIHEFQYERSLLQAIQSPLQSGDGEVALVAFKDKTLAPGERVIEPLLGDDQ